MESLGMAKFTRLLPLSIRKDGSGGVNVTGSGNLFGQQNSMPRSDQGGGGGGGFGDADLFRDPFRDNVHNGNSSSSPTMACSTGMTNSTEQKEVVRVTMTYPAPSAGALNPHKEISLRLTNDENPTFFYHLRITEADYPQIKSQQGLLVDLYGFPNQLITLLEKCDPTNVTDSEERSVIGAGPKFLLVMKVGLNNSVLDIVESNPFKYLCHLSLQINPGSDLEVKKYLADVTTGLKKECSLLNEKYSHMATAMEAEVTRLKKLLEQKNNELTVARDEMHSQANTLSSKHFSDMTEEKEKLLKLQSDLATKFENERQDIERRHSQTVSSLEARITSLEASNRDLAQIKYQNETTLQTYSTRIKTLDSDLKVLQGELTTARKKNEKLDTDYHEKQRSLNALQSRLAVLEADTKEKQNTLERQRDFINQSKDQKKFLEDRVTSLAIEVDKQRNISKSVSGELMKANEIIRKLQDDIRSLHTKTKLQNQISVKQEEKIVDLEKHLQQSEESAAKLKSQIASLEESEVKAKDELEEALEKISTLEDTIKSNENMISWLNKQLNEFQGLGNLTRFRQNLASTGSGVGVGARYPPPEAVSHANSSTGAVNGSAIRGGAGLYSSNLHNSLPNGTPSWMNIYQSTSTPHGLDQDNDLSSRFERISASNNNYTLGGQRSRLDTISEKTGDRTNLSERNNPGQYGQSTKGDENQNPAAQKKKSPIEKSTLTSGKTVASKPPTWAKPRTGKVTLEVMGPNRAQNTNAWRNT